MAAKAALGVAAARHGIYWTMTCSGRLLPLHVLAPFNNFIGLPCLPLLALHGAGALARPVGGQAQRRLSSPRTAKIPVSSRIYSPFIASLPL
jgi:hypothetical protein